MYTSQRNLREPSGRNLEIPMGMSMKAGAPSPSPTDVTDEEEMSFSRTPDSRSGAGSPMTAISEQDNIYCVIAVAIFERRILLATLVSRFSARPALANLSSAHRLALSLMRQRMAAQSALNFAAVPTLRDTSARA